MRLGKASAYAVFATVYIARHLHLTPIQGRDIAQACDIPVDYLLKILQLLVRGQILSSERGRSGGFSLRRTPDEITLLQIVEAVEGPLVGELSVRQSAPHMEEGKQHIDHLCEDIATYARSMLSRTTVLMLTQAE